MATAGNDEGMAPVGSSKATQWNRLLSRAKTLTLVGLILGLGALNFLTLTDAGIHGKAYGVVEALAVRSGLEVLQRVVRERSPTHVGKRKLEQATKVLRDKNDVLVSEKNSLIAKTAHLEAEHTKLQASHKDLRNSNAALESKHKELETQHEHQKRVVVKNKESVRALGAKVGPRAVKSAARNAASLAGEAIPYFGIGLAVSVAALDIYDACQTLKDLNEVAVEMEIQPTDERTVCGLHVPTKDEVVQKAASNWTANYEAAATEVRSAYEAAAKSVREGTSRAAEALDHLGRAVPPLQPPAVTGSEIKELVSPVFPWLFEK